MAIYQKHSWPNGLKRSEYFSKGPDERAVLRQKFRFMIKNGNPKMLGPGEEPRPARHRGGTGGSTKITTWPRKNEPANNAKPGEDKFPRTQAGAIAFIRAWNSAKDGNEFVQKYGNDEKSFWAAMTHKANMFREKGIKLKVLKKQKGEAHLYDWDLLKQVAAETQD